MKVHHTEYKKNYVNYILGTIYEDIDGKPLTEKQAKIDYIFNRFYSEYDWNIKRIGKLNAMTEWLQGLALDIEYTNGSIIQLAEEMCSIEPNPSEKMQEKILANYWRFMAQIILSMKPITTHKVIKDKNILFIGKLQECCNYLQNCQPFSFSHAIDHEGFNILDTI